MLRTFAVALVTIAAVSAAAPRDTVHAQPLNVADQYKFPLEMAGATPGVSIEIILNGQKQGDAVADPGGSANWVLELVGKSQVTLYVDVCKDGKIVKVMVVTGGGAAPPEDESCRRRLAALSFRSDCGVVRITLDLTNWNGRVIGCGITITDPKILATIGGAALVPVVLIAGGGAPPTVAATTPTPPAQTTTTTTTTTTNPQPPAPQPTIEFTVTISGGSWNHPPGENTSFICTVVVTNPPQPGAQWTATVQGPFVVAGQNFSGTLNARGQAEIRARISNVGAYTFTVTVVSGGVSRSGTSSSINVTFLNNQCPSAQTFAP